MAKPKQAQDGSKATIEARVLAEIEVFGVKHPANSIVIVSEDIAEAYKHSLDSSPEAVAYAKDDGAEAVEVIEPTAEEQADE